MYGYRRMTEAQRREVVALRVSRGFPLHRPPHPDLGSGWYFITGACFEHQKHFSKPQELTALQRRLFEAIAEINAECGGWVVLPNHYHLLVKLSQVEAEAKPDGLAAPDHDVRCLAALGRVLGKVHGRSAHYANRRDESPGRRVWCRFSDRKIRSERHYWASLHYIFINPLKHGYVDELLEWPWSSVHDFVAERGPERLKSLRRDFPLVRFGDGWDD